MIPAVIFVVVVAAVVLSRLQDVNDGDFDWDDSIYVSRAFHICGALLGLRCLRLTTVTARATLQYLITA